MDNTDKIIIGNRLAQLRKERFLTLDEIAERFDPPICRTTINHWENARNFPSGRHLVQIADYYDVSIDYLYGRTDSRKMINKERIQSCMNTN